MKHTTKVINSFLTIASVLVFIFIFGGIFLFPSIKKIFRINLPDGMEFALIFPVGCLAILVIILLSALVSRKQKGERRQVLQKFARQQGWRYTEQMSLAFLKEFDAYLNDSWLGTANILTGSSENILTGKMNGRNIIVSDQTYSTGSGETSVTYKQTLVGLELTEAQLPIMSLYPETFKDRVLAGFRKFDIDFAARPAFSRKYVLYGRNENHIRHFFNNKIIDFYERQPAFSTVCGGKYLIVYGEKLLKPNEIMAQLNLTFHLAQLFLKK